MAGGTQEQAASQQSLPCHLGSTPATLPGPTENGAPTQRVATKSEDMRVVRGDKGHCVRLICELAGPVNGVIKTDSLSQRQVSSGLMVTLIDEAPCGKITGEVGPWESDLSPLPHSA